MISKQTPAARGISLGRDEEFMAGSPRDYSFTPATRGIAKAPVWQDSHSNKLAYPFSPPQAPHDIKSGTASQAHAEPTRYPFRKYFPHASNICSSLRRELQSIKKFPYFHLQLNRLFCLAELIEAIGRTVPAPVLLHTHLIFSQSEGRVF